MATGNTRAATGMPGSQRGKSQPVTTRRAAVPARDQPEPAAAPMWLQVATMLLSLGGLGVSLYLTVAHYTTSMTLACPDTGVVNCFVICLIYTELFTLDAICLWCTSVHVITFLLFALIVSTITGKSRPSGTPAGG